MLPKVTRKSTHILKHSIHGMKEKRRKNISSLSHISGSTIKAWFKEQNNFSPRSTEQQVAAIFVIL